MSYTVSFRLSVSDDTSNTFSLLLNHAETISVTNGQVYTATDYCTVISITSGSFSRRNSDGSYGAVLSVGDFVSKGQLISNSLGSSGSAISLMWKAPYVRYFACKKDADAGTNEIAANLVDYAVGNVTTGSVGDWKSWYISPVLSTGTTTFPDTEWVNSPLLGGGTIIRPTAGPVDSIYSGTPGYVALNPDGVYYLYPYFLTASYFATEVEANIGLHPLTNYTSPYGIIGDSLLPLPLYSNISWKIGALSDGTASRSQTYSRTTPFIHDGVYYFYPAVVTATPPPVLSYYASKADADAGTNVIAVSSTDYTVGTVSTGSIGAYNTWKISSTLSTGTSNNTSVYTNTTALNASGVYYLYPTRTTPTILYFTTAHLASLGTNPDATNTMNYTIGATNTGIIETQRGLNKYNVLPSEDDVWRISPTLSTGSSPQNKWYSNREVLNNDGVYYLYQAVNDSNTTPSLIYCASEADAVTSGFTSNPLYIAYARNPDYTVGHVTAGSIGSYNSWIIQRAFGNGSPVPSYYSAIAYLNGSKLPDFSNTGIYYLYPGTTPDLKIAYFASQSDADNSTGVIATNISDYTVGTVSEGSIGTTTSWKISSVYTTGTSSNTGAYTNTTTLNSPGIYYLYPASIGANISYFANLADANAGTNAIATNLSDYTIGTVTTGSIGSTTSWKISSTLSTGTSNVLSVYTNTTTLDSNGAYFLYPAPVGANISYFATQADANAGTNVIATNLSDYAVGTVTTGSIGSTTSWKISGTLSTGTSNNASVYANTTVLNSPGVYYLYPTAPAPKISYFANQTNAIAGTNAIATNAGSYAVGTVTTGSIGSTTSWKISGTLSSGTSSNTGVYTNGMTLNSSGSYYLYPNVPCFLEGTKVLCLVDGIEKYVCVEDLTRGTLVKTSRNGYKKVDIIKKSPIVNPGHSERVLDRLYVCSQSKYPELTENLYITGCHSILVDSITDKERADTIKYLNRIFVTEKKYRLIAAVDERAEPWTSEGTYNIWHFALENESELLNYGVFVNGGLLVETCHIGFLKNKVNTC